jgi:hypothetical protein
MALTVAYFILGAVGRAVERIHRGASLSADGDDAIIILLRLTVVPEFGNTPIADRFVAVELCGNHWIFAIPTQAESTLAKAFVEHS